MLDNDNWSAFCKCFTVAARLYFTDGHWYSASSERYPIITGMFRSFPTFYKTMMIILQFLFSTRSEALVRIAFQCLQLVVTDFLPVMTWRCLPLCVDTAAKFGSQTQELNISLTAVGLMVSGCKWHFDTRIIFGIFTNHSLISVEHQRLLLSKSGKAVPQFARRYGISLSRFSRYDEYATVR